MNSGFSCFRGKHVSLHPNEIAKIEQLFENNVIKRFILIWADFIAIQIQLNPTGCVLQFGKRCLAHDALAHQPPRDAHIGELFAATIVIFFDFFCRTVDFKQVGGVGINA